MKDSGASVRDLPWLMGTPEPPEGEAGHDLREMYGRIVDLGTMIDISYENYRTLNPHTK